MDGAPVPSQTPPPDTDQAPVVDALQALGAELMHEFGIDKAARYEQELEWLKDYRQYRGVYDPEILARLPKNRSRAFIRLTRAKVRSTTAAIFDMLFPAGDRNFTAEPTPVPSLDRETHVSLIARALMDARADPAQAGQMKPEDMLKLVREFSEKAARAAQTKMDDYLAEGHYQSVAREVMRFGHLYGTGVLKGPLTESCVTSRWVERAVGDQIVTQVVQEQERRPGLECRPVWCIYPDASATNPEDAEHFYDRHVMNRSQVVKLGRARGFDRKAIMEYVLQHPDGDASQMEHWESEIRTTSNRLTQGPARNRFILLERWGYLYGDRLMRIGIDKDTMGQPIDPGEQYESSVWLLGGRVVKAMLNPMPTKYRPYHFYFYERDEGNFWGEGVARIYRDPQSLFNASIRVTIDNAAMAGGPMTEINRDLLEDEEDAEEIGPFRVYIRHGQGEDAKAPAIRVYDIPSNVDQNLRMAGIFKELGDEVSSVPSYQYGQNSKGAANTVGGLEMLMGRSEIGLKDVATSWDKGITEPFMTALYDWMMQFTQDQSLRGDAKIVARGATALVSRAMRAQALMALRASTANPLDAPFVKRQPLLEGEARAMGLNPHEYIRTEDEVKSEGNDLPPEVMAHIQQLTAALEQAEAEKAELEKIAERALKDAEDEREGARAEAEIALTNIRAERQAATDALTIMQERTRRIVAEARARMAQARAQQQQNERAVDEAA